MKILIVSDTHKKNENYFKVLEMTPPGHCDPLRQMWAVSMHFLLRQNARFISFGNNDFSRISPERSHWISDPTKYG